MPPWYLNIAITTSSIPHQLFVTVVVEGRKDEEEIKMGSVR